ncbi:MAG TPA: ester cyclase [Terriglobia bacterium]|nr:ester cyclase [Terriglobia bacterium]
MPSDNKNIARRIIDEVWNQGKLDALNDAVAANYLGHDTLGPEIHGLEAFKKRIHSLRTAFPDLHLTVEDMFADGDVVVTRFNSRGTHKGSFQGIAPTGKHCQVSGITISRFADGKIAEAWVQTDALGLMQQLGAVPALGQAKAQAAPR